MHSSGSHPPLEPQNGAINPSVSMTGQSECANAVAEVPKLITTTPGAAAPAPMALIMLSPPPAATGVPSTKPDQAAPAAET